MTEETKGHPSFWDAIDDMDGESEYKPLPEDDYDFKVTNYTFGTSKPEKGGELYCKAEYTVTNDRDGLHDGRKVWELIMLEGVGQDGRTKAFNLVRLLKALRHYAELNQSPLEEDVIFPPYVNAETRLFDSPPVNEDGTKDSRIWDDYFGRLVGLHFFAKTKQKARSYTKDGETVNVVEDAIKAYITK